MKKKNILLFISKALLEKDLDFRIFPYPKPPLVILFINDRRNQLFFATGIECGIHDLQVLKYQPLVKSRLIFQYSMIINGIKWFKSDVTDGWYFRTWRSSMSTSLPEALSNWEGLLWWSLSSGDCENTTNKLKKLFKL